ncbi:MAG: methionine--tRNA ligase [Thermoprotei archaeon]|nr:MAG: methionine--tRNA ligase [Thermoprotei archaeon]
MRWLICSAWPYINNVPHLGTLVGSLLSADVFARFLRLMGEEALLVSGSDEHGTPIEVEALRLGVDPKKFTDESHRYIVELLKKWELSYDNYTRTENPIHKEFVQHFMNKMLENGYIFSRNIVMPYCENEKMFLPDRFVEGVCPFCGYEYARGDQCDKCGTLLDPIDLIDPRCVFCGFRPTFMSTKHWFFDLPKLEDKVREWLKNSRTIDENVKTYCFSLLDKGLKARSITRDNKWGIPAPFPGAEGKTIYVWFEALLGYLSATLEYFIKEFGREEGLKKFYDYWKNADARTVYFIGKDNIPFHAIILPAMLLASGEGYVLPYKISATEYLMFEGEKFSKSKGIGVWIDEALEIADVDYWRFALMRLRPEGKDVNFTWREFYRIVNTELNDDIGNFIHRVLTFIYSRFGAKVPGIKKLASEDEELFSIVKHEFEEYKNRMYDTRIKQATENILNVARECNAYLNRREPWKLIKLSKDEAGSVMTLLVNIVKGLGLMLAPFTPKASTKLWRMLRLGDEIPRGALRRAFEIEIQEGHIIEKPMPLFRKLPEDFLSTINAMIRDVRKRINERRPPYLRF